MNNVYIKGLGIPVGTFDEKDLKNGGDKKEVEKYMKEYPEYGYVNTKIIKEHGIRKLAVYICSANDFKIMF